MATRYRTTEAIKEENGKYLAYTDNGREYTGIDVFEWAQKVDELGAGEIVITSVDKEGTGQGFDLDLITPLCQLNIPFVCCGGAKNAKDFSMIFEKFCWLILFIFFLRIINASL